MQKNIKLGDYSSLAKSYRQSRPNYAAEIKGILKLIISKEGKISTLDLGSGTGIFSKLISQVSKQVVGVELSKEMIKNAHKSTKIKYINSSVEKLKLKKKFDLITSASSFHWFDDAKLRRIIEKNLKQNGIFFITYNSRVINKNPFLVKVEKKIYSLNKSFKKRVSSGSSKFVEKKINNFLEISDLKGPIYLEFFHHEKFSLKRYLTVWDSSNEFRNKLGEKNHELFKTWIKRNFPKEGIIAEYKNKSWLLQKK